MEIRHRLVQFNNSPKFELLKVQLQALGCEAQVHENGALSSVEYSFSEHAPFAPDLLAFVQANGIFSQSALHYTEDEILSAEWVLAGVGEFQYPQPEDHYVEATYDTQDYCSRCGQGKKQNRPFRLKKDFSQKQAKFLGLHWVFDEIFVRPVIVDLFNSAGISGLKYREVIQHKTHQPFTTIFQLDIPVMDTPALVVDNLFAVTCKPHNEESLVNNLPGLPFCGRIKYHYPLTEPIKFKASLLSGLPDFARSAECYGSGAAANHFILVRKKVVRLIKERGIEGLGFPRPVHLV